MATSLRQDAWKLVMDGNKIRERIRTISGDCHSWSVCREQDDLMALMRAVREAETDVSLLLVDAINEKKLMPLAFSRIFAYLDALFQDIKDARSDLADGYVSHGTVGSLEIDGRRFNKTVIKIVRELGVKSGKRVNDEKQEVCEKEVPTRSRLRVFQQKRGYAHGEL